MRTCLLTLTTFDSGRLLSHPEVAGQNEPTFNSNEGSVGKHYHFKASNIDITDQFLPNMVERTHALAISQRDIFHSGWV